MKKSTKTNIFLSILFFSLFIIYTLSVKYIDVNLIGNKLSPVGFSSLNEIFFNIFSKVKYDGPFVDNSFQMICFHLSEIFGYFALMVSGFFALLGAIQLLSNKSFKKVNKNIYALGGFYIVAFSIYVFFEKVIINYRPVIMPNSFDVEPSYPSSHTILTLCFLASAVIVIRYIFPKLPQKAFNIITIILFIIMALTIATRLMSGVHWFTDIIGGVIISIALLMSFKTVIDVINE